VYLRGDLSLEHPSRKRPQVALGAILRGVRTVVGKEAALADRNGVGYSNRP